jgi:hypothetical protein
MSHYFSIIFILYHIQFKNTTRILVPLGGGISSKKKRPRQEEQEVSLLIK